MTITLSAESALTLAAQILDQQMERAANLSSVVAVQRAINNTPGASGAKSEVSLSIQDAEQLADAMAVLRKVVEKRLEFN